jgi:hypothetical protein
VRDALSDLKRFYDLLDQLEQRVGGRRRLFECTGRLDWPHRGVYFFFEEGEQKTGSGEGPRVVRVGTHALTSGSKTKLWNRLSQHRGSARTGGGNHRGSIFRLLVGEALGNRDPAPGLESWGKGSSAGAEIRAHERAHERRVSTYLGAMPFLWLEVDDAPGAESIRGVIERNAIALLSGLTRSPVDPPSPGWLGHFSDREKVRHSGLWNQNHVDEPYSASFLDELECQLLAV